jgi:hypothetical protein
VFCFFCEFCVRDYLPAEAFPGDSSSVDGSERRRDDLRFTTYD